MIDYVAQAGDLINSSSLILAEVDRMANQPGVLPQADFLHVNQRSALIAIAQAQTLLLLKIVECLDPRERERDMSVTLN